MPFMVDMISAVLPLKITGRHYADNLNRCDLLFCTLRHFGLAPLFAEVLVGARQRTNLSELPCRALVRLPDPLSGGTRIPRCLP